VGRQFLVIDVKRQTPLGLVVTLLMVAPLAAAAAKMRPSSRYAMHDGGDGRVSCGRTLHG
jgi:hypothetical protein